MLRARGKWHALACLMFVTVAMFITVAHGDESFVRLMLDGRHVRWSAQPAHAPLTLTYAFATEDVQSGTIGRCGRLVAPAELMASSGLKPDDFVVATSRAFQSWESVANIEFRWTADPASAQIVIGAQAEPLGVAFANLTLAAEVHSGDHIITSAAICLNPDRLWKVRPGGSAGAFDLEYVLAHEIGHTLGLDHPSARGHLMSFKYIEQRSVLSQGDAQGAMALYGARPVRN